MKGGVLKLQSQEECDNVELYLSAVLLENSDEKEIPLLFLEQEKSYCKEHFSLMTWGMTLLFTWDNFRHTCFKSLFLFPQ